MSIFLSFRIGCDIDTTVTKGLQQYYMEYNITTVIYTMKYWQVKLCGDIAVLKNVKEKTVKLLHSTSVIIVSKFWKQTKMSHLTSFILVFI